MLAGLLVLSAAAGLVTSPTAPQRYKVDAKLVQELDLSGLGAGKQSSEVTGSAWISVTMSDTAGGRIAHVVVDSVTASPSGQAMEMTFTGEALSSAKGATYHLYIVNGKVQGTPKASVETAGLAFVNQALPVLFSGARAGLKIGDSWADTVKINTVTEDSKQDGVTITTWTAISAEGDAFLLEGSSAGTMSGEQQGGQITMSGKTTATQKITTTVGGPSRGGQIEVKVDAQVIAPQAPDPIPLLTTAAITVTTIP